MPPARSIFVDTDRILRSIAEQSTAQAEAARESCIGMMRGDEALPGRLQQAEWVPRKLHVLAGRLLTPSQRKRHQEALRELEAAGLVDLCTVWVRLTDAGRVLATQPAGATAIALAATLGEPPEVAVDG